jgi:HEAT repeat protein
MNRNRFAGAVLGAILVACAHFSTAQNSSPTQPRRASSARLAAAQPPQVVAWKILKNGVSDQHASRRQASVIALSTIGASNKAVDLVFSVLQDKDSSVRETAATALGEMHSVRAVAALKQSLEDDSGAVRFAAAKALWQLGDHSGRSLLEEVLSKQGTASDGMVRQGLNDANKKLHSPGDLARIGLIQASGAFLGPFSFGVVMAEELAKDKGAPTRAISASLLASDRDPKSVRALEDAIQDENAAVRAAAAKAIGSHPCKQLLPDLQFLFDDKDQVKYMAAASIIRIQSRLESKTSSAECQQLNQVAQQTTPAGQ